MDIPERRDKLNKLAEQIARHIPDWTLAPVDPDGNHQDRRFLRKGDMRIGISLDWRLPRMNIGTWEWPTYQKWDQRYNGSEWVKEHVRPSSLYEPRVDAPDITVSAEKSPQQIATDIKRRFIPQYQAVWDRCAKLAARYGKDEQENRQVWVDACKIIKADPKHLNHYVNVDGRHLRVQHRGSTVHIEMDATLEQLSCVVEALRGDRR